MFCCDEWRVLNIAFIIQNKDAKKTQQSIVDPRGKYIRVKPGTFGGGQRGFSLSVMKTFGGVFERWNRWRGSVKAYAARDASTDIGLINKAAMRRARKSLVKTTDATAGAAGTVAAGVDSGAKAAQKGLRASLIAGKKAIDSGGLLGYNDTDSHAAPDDVPTRSQSTGKAAKKKRISIGHGDPHNDGATSEDHHHEKGGTRGDHDEADRTHEILEETVDLSIFEVKQLLKEGTLSKRVSLKPAGNFSVLEMDISFSLSYLVAQQKERRGR